MENGNYHVGTPFSDTVIKQKFYASEPVMVPTGKKRAYGDLIKSKDSRLCLKYKTMSP